MLQRGKGNTQPKPEVLQLPAGRPSLYYVDHAVGTENVLIKRQGGLGFGGPMCPRIYSSVAL